MFPMMLSSPRPRNVSVGDGAGGMYKYLISIIIYMDEIDDVIDIIETAVEIVESKKASKIQKLFSKLKCLSLCYNKTKN